MSDEYQLRKDVDRFKKFLDQLESILIDKLNIDDLDIDDLLNNYYTTGDVDTLLSNLIESIDEKIDTETIMEELSHKADQSDLDSQVTILNNAISGKANSTHYHTWTGKTLNDNVRLYVNETLGLCELKFSRVFSSATANTNYTWYTNLIPKQYRPTRNIFGAMNYDGTIRVYADGTIGGMFGQSLGRFTALGSAMWHYGLKSILSDWFNYNNLTVNETNNQILLTNSGSSWGGYFSIESGSSASSLSDVLDWGSPFRVEVDIVSFSGDSYIQIYDGSNTLQKHLSTDLEIPNNSHLIIISDGETVIWDVNGSVKLTDEVVLGTSRIGFRVNANSTVTFKNWNIEQ